MGSRRTVKAHDWTLIPAKSGVSVIDKFTAGRIPNHGWGETRAGDYYLQLIYFRAYLPKPTAHTPDEMASALRYDQDFAGTELFRSNVVKVHFVK